MSELIAKYLFVPVGIDIPAALKPRNTLSHLFFKAQPIGSTSFHHELSSWHSKEFSNKFSPKCINLLSILMQNFFNALIFLQSMILRSRENASSLLLFQFDLHPNLLICFRKLCFPLSYVLHHHFEGRFEDSGLENWFFFRFWAWDFNLPGSHQAENLGDSTITVLTLSAQVF